jgi:hypothetical protein
MTTAFANITAAFITALSTEPAVSSHIFRARDRQIAEDCTDAVNVQFDGAEPNAGVMHNAPVDWRSRISVECYARSSSSSGDVAVDALLAAVYARLAQDTTLGGVVDDIGMPTLEAEYETQGQKTGWVRLTYSVLHRTSNLTLD